MNQLDSFKQFVQTKPDFVSLVTSGQYNWQQLYEMYTIYGGDHEIWQQITKKEINKSSMDLLQLIKNIDIDSLILGMQGLEKILDLFAGYLESNSIKTFDD